MKSARDAGDDGFGRGDGLIGDFKRLFDIGHRLRKLLLGIGVHDDERLAFDEDKVITDEPNFLASVALYRLGRSETPAG